MNDFLKKLAIGAVILVCPVGLLAKDRCPASEDIRSTPIYSKNGEYYSYYHSRQWEWAGAKEAKNESLLFSGEEPSNEFDKWPFGQASDVNPAEDECFYNYRFQQEYPAASHQEPTTVDAFAIMKTTATPVSGLADCPPPQNIHSKSRGGYDYEATFDGEYFIGRGAVSNPTGEASESASKKKIECRYNNGVLLMATLDQGGEGSE